MDKLKCVTGKELDEAIARSNITVDSIRASFPQLRQLLGIGEKTSIPSGGELKRLSEAEADTALASLNITREQVEASFSQLDQLLGISGKTSVATSAGSAGQPLHQEDVKKGENHE